MDNNIAMNALVFLQILGFIFVYEEKDKMLKDWKDWRIDRKIGRIFFLFLPITIMISLTFNPL
jgi:hypothetical protein